MEELAVLHDDIIALIVNCNRAMTNLLEIILYFQEKWFSNISPIQEKEPCPEPDTLSHANVLEIYNRHMIYIVQLKTERYFYCQSSSSIVTQEHLCRPACRLQHQNARH